MRRDLPVAPSLLNGGDILSPVYDFEKGSVVPPGPLLFLPLLLVQGGGMDLSRVGEKILSSVRSARSLGLLPTDRPEVPARAAAAAAVARVLAGLPPHERFNLSSSSSNAILGYDDNEGQVIEQIEDLFYEEDFDPVMYILDSLPSDESDTAEYLDKQSTVRLTQLDKIAERLSRHVMEHHEEMVRGMHLVTELEQDLKVANVICMNGRRHIALSKNEVSRDLVVNLKSKRKQTLLDMLPILAELAHAVDIQMELEGLVEGTNYRQAFQLLPEYLQTLENYSELSAVQEMSHGIETWMVRTMQKLDSHLLGVCQSFNEEGYITVIDAYALMGDIGGMAEKMQSYFLQEVLSQTHSILKETLQEEIGDIQMSRFTYSDLCGKVTESTFQQCLLKTLESLFKLMCSYYSVMVLSPSEKELDFETSNIPSGQSTIYSDSIEAPSDSQRIELRNQCSAHSSQIVINDMPNCPDIGASERLEAASTSSANYVNKYENSMHSRNSPFYQLRIDAVEFVARTLDRGKRNFWQLTTSRVSVLLSSPAISLTSTYQFLRNYEDLNSFILAGEAFCGIEAAEFRQKLKSICESYQVNFHRQNVHALKMVLEKESWTKMPLETTYVISLAGLTGDGAPIISPSSRSTMSAHSYSSNYHLVDPKRRKNGFSSWLKVGNPFSSKLDNISKDVVDSSSPRETLKRHQSNALNDESVPLEDENEDLLADFIDEDSQLPSRISKAQKIGGTSVHWTSEEISSQTGSSLCLLRFMDKYARLMQKLEIVSAELFKGICQLFGIFYRYVYETFGEHDRNQSGKSFPDNLPSRLKTALSKISQDCDQWIRPQSMPSSPSSPFSYNATFNHMDITPTIPPSTMFGLAPSTSFGLKERCAAAETVSIVARILNRSKVHIQSMLSQNIASEDFYQNVVDTVPDLVEHIHRISAKMLLHINGYADKIANAKWEVKELGVEHNGYVDLLLGEYKHYKTRLAHGGVSKEVQELLLDYGVDCIAEVLIEGLSRIKRCSDEGRALMSLDLQVFMNGLQHFVSVNVKPKFQSVDIFIKAYYLPETEYVHWARSHPEFTKNQVIGLVNLVATMKGWKRKTKLEVLEKIETGS